MINKRIGIIGCGNMGEAMIGGLVRVIEKSTMLMASETDAARRDAIQDKYKIIVQVDNNYVVKNSDVVIIAVKPQDIDALLKNEICCGVTERKLIISIAAGIPTKHVENIIGRDAHVVRAMPNMAAVIGESATAIAAGSSATKDDMRLAGKIFSTIGDVVEAREALMDAVTAVSGSGPAYFFYLIECLVEAARELGLDKKTASELVVKTALGSAKLLESLRHDAEDMRAKVTSKGGTTEAAFKIFKSKDIKGIIKQAVKAAAKRSKELSGR